MNIVFIILFLSSIFFNICFSNFNRNMMFIYGGVYTPLFKDNILENKSIKVDDFLFDKFHVTNYDFLVFVLNSPNFDINNIKSLFSDNGYLNHWSCFENFIDILDKPVVNVSWFSSSEFCNFYSSRLPSLDEWEYVSNSNKNVLYFKNQKILWHNILSWYINTQNSSLINVLNMPEDSFGISGMHGFIWEWVNDFNSIILINSDAEGGGLEELLFCGSTAINSIDPADYISFMRFAFRNSLEANYTMNRLGVRCAKNIY